MLCFTSLDLSGKERFLISLDSLGMGTCIFLYWHFCVMTYKSSCSSKVILLLFATGLNCTVQNVGPAGSSSCQMDHRQSYRDQDAQNCQSESHKAGAEHLPAQGEPLNTHK